MVTALEGLTEIDRKLPLGLVPSQFWNHALHISSRYRGLSSSHYAECRLGEHRNPRVDLLFAIEQLRDSHPLDHQHDLGPLWANWRLPDSALSRAPMVWFELDDIRSKSPPHPSMSVCLLDGYRNWRQPQLELNPPSRDLAAHVIRLAGGGRHLVTLAQRCMERFQCIHISVMAGRTPTTHKLYGVVQRHDMAEFLNAIGWRGPVAEILGLLQHHFQPQWCNDDIYIDLTLDSLTDSGGNRLGLVFPQQHVIHSDGDATRRALVEHLVAHRLCSPEQAAELMSWTQPDQVLVSNRSMSIRTWFDIKIVWDPDDGVTAKAYLGFDSHRAGLFG